MDIIIRQSVTRYDQHSEKTLIPNKAYNNKSTTTTTHLMVLLSGKTRVSQYQKKIFTHLHPIFVGTNWYLQLTSYIYNSP